MKNLHGKRAIVTGVSRLSGIGAAICREFAKRGADVFFTYYFHYDQTLGVKGENDEPMRLAKELESHGVAVAHLELDLSEDNAYVQIFNAFEQRFGTTADILVNNACVSVNDSYETITSENLDAHYVINVRATTLLTSEFAKRFSKGHGGRIIQLTTGWSQGPMANELSYAITKSTVEALTYTLKTKLAKKGIAINAVNPGPTNSGWMSDQLKQELLPRFPFGRLGEPKDAANLIAFLASDDAEWITGQVIHSEGGFQNTL